MQTEPLRIIDHERRLGTAGVAGIPNRSVHRDSTTEQARPRSGQCHDILWQVNNLVIGNDIGTGHQVDEPESVKHQRGQVGHQPLAVTDRYPARRLKHGYLAQGKVDAVRLQLLLKVDIAFDERRLLLQ